MVTMNSISASLEGFTSPGLSSLESTRRSALHPLALSLTLSLSRVPFRVFPLPFSPLSPSLPRRTDYIPFLDRPGHLDAAESFDTKRNSLRLRGRQDRNSRISLAPPPPPHTHMDEIPLRYCPFGKSRSRSVF